IHAEREVAGEGPGVYVSAALVYFVDTSKGESPSLSSRPRRSLRPLAADGSLRRHTAGAARRLQVEGEPSGRWSVRSFARASGVRRGRELSPCVLSSPS